MHERLLDLLEGVAFDDLASLFMVTLLICPDGSANAESSSN